LKDHTKKFTFGQKISSSLGIFMVLKNGNHISDDDVTVRINSIEGKSAQYSSKLQIEAIGKKTSVLKLSVTDPIPEKGMDFLNALVQQYNFDAAEDKNSVAKNTAKFIAVRLGIISHELDSVERGAETFKKENRLTDLTSDAGLSLQSSASYEKAVVDNETQLKIVDYMLDIVRKSDASTLIPNNILSSTGSGASTLIEEYNRLVLQRQRLLKSATKNNPSVVNIEEQLSGIRSNILESLNNTRSSLMISQRDLKRQESMFNGQVGQVPTNERQYNVIARQQKIKESLYLYLLQKREETAISLAVTSPKAKVIDTAYSNGLVAPNKKMIMLIAFLIGLLLPIGIIFLADMLDNKIHSRQDVEKLTTIPYLGDVPLSDENK
ncbi:MAG: tyrosine protein kinase, partial [Flavobacterium sp.]